MDIEIMVEGEGLAEIETIRIPEGSTAREIVVAVAVKGGYPAEEAVLYVEDWAVGPEGFKIDPAIAPEMELALRGTAVALPKNAHIGRYIRHPHHELAFDLIRGIVPNGDSL